MAAGVPLGYSLAVLCLLPWLFLGENSQHHWDCWPAKPMPCKDTLSVGGKCQTLEAMKNECGKKCRCSSDRYGQCFYWFPVSHTMRHITKASIVQFIRAETGASCDIVNTYHELKPHFKLLCFIFPSTQRCVNATSSTFHIGIRHLSFHSAVRSS